MDCPGCHSANPDEAKFCLNCGTPLQVPRLAEGDRKLVTVLFADVVGSTAIGEELDPEQVAEIMNGAFGFLNAAIVRYGGMVARLMGDGVLALFGAPVAHEDDPERAVHAALAMQEAAGGYARGVRASYEVDFAIRVGIHTGRAVITVVGDGAKTEYTPMGDVANVAARLQSMAEPGTIFISADTYRLVRSVFEVVSHGKVAVKGRSEPVEIYQIERAKAVRGTSRGLEGLSSPLVGRDRELRLVQEGVQGLDSDGACMAIVGEAGLGKSRLLAEIQTWTRERQPAVRWLEGRAISYGQTIAYYPWRQAIRQGIGAQESDPAEVVREKLQAACAACSLEAGLPYLQRMLAVETPEAQEMLASLSGSELVRRIGSATGSYLRALSAAGPLVVMFDDLHWADEASLQLIGATAPLVAEIPLLLICVVRPDKSAGSWAMLARLRESLGARLTVIDLEPLSEDDSHLLLGNLLYVQDLPEAVREAILRRSEGNPFFLEEVIRSLIDSKHIVREDGHWRATQEIADVTIPETLAGVLSARIDRLPEKTKRVAQTAAVIGRIFPYLVLTEACASLPSTERVGNPQPHLGTLAYEDLVRERARDPELEYIFKHALTQEAAYDLLLLRRRKDYHRRVGEALEHLYPERLDDLAPMLAHHFWNGEDWTRAAHYARRAGERAEAVFALRESVDQYDRAYQALKREPQPPPESLIDATLLWAKIAYLYRPVEAVVERLREAEALARELGDRRRLALALSWAGTVYVNSGFPSLGIPLLNESGEIASEIGEVQLSLSPTFWITVGMVDQDPRRAVVELTEVVRLAREYHFQDVEAHALGMKAVAHARLGQSEAARELSREAIQLAEEIAVPVKLADVHETAALAAFEMGDIEGGLEHSRLGRDLSAQVGAEECRIFGTYCLGLGDLRQGNPAQARADFQDGIQHLKGFMSRFLKNRLEAGVLMADALEGRPGAPERLEERLEKTRSFGDSYTAALLNQSVAGWYQRSGELEKADASLQQALDFYRSNGMGPALSRALLLLAELRDLQGRASDAEAARAEAESLTAVLPV